MNNQDKQPRPGGGKKRRIIHWNPEEEEAGQSNADSKNRGPMFFLPVFAGLLIFGVLAFAGLKYFTKSPEGMPTGNNSGVPAMANTANGAEQRFVSPQSVQRKMDRLKVEITAIRKVTDDHPALIRNLVTMETAFDKGNKNYMAGQYREAMRLLEEVEGLIADQRSLITLQIEAKTVHDNFLNLIEASEAGRALAPFEFEKAATIGSEAEIHLSNGAFTEAILSFKAALETIREMDDIFYAHLAEMELSGKKALHKGDKEEAREFFQKVLELQPDNELALRNIKRAATIDRVLPLLRKAKENEKNKQYDEALTAYERAFHLDAYSAKAQQGISRLTKIIRDNRLAYLRTTSKKAEEELDWDTAIETYETAVEEFPEITEFPDALEVAREKGHQAKIASAMDEAYAIEEEHNWELARNAFLRLLDLDNENEEALEGLQRNGVILRNLLKYEKFLGDAGDFAAKGDFQKAIIAFNEAMMVKPSYVTLAPEHQDLKDTLRDQSQPVRINFVSDGKTWVSITGFQMIGKFEQHHLRILPGNYRVKGRRKGYRDIVLEVRVRYDSSFGDIPVICTQRI